MKYESLKRIKKLLTSIYFLWHIYIQCSFAQFMEKKVKIIHNNIAISAYSDSAAALQMPV